MSRTVLWLVALAVLVAPTACTSRPHGRTAATTTTQEDEVELHPLLEVEFL